MYAMQYQIALPADYDMDVIRKRVRATGRLMDGFPGLEFKAYLVQEKAEGASRNAYAPFYVWRDTAGMRNFCWGEPGYSSIVRDFGRHSIQDWTVHKVARGPSSFASARSLSFRTVSLPSDVAPSSCVEDLSASFLSEADGETVARVAAVDVTAWDLILVELSAAHADQSAAGRAVYEVLHVSEGS